MEENKKMEVEPDWLPEGYRTDEIKGGRIERMEYETMTPGPNPKKTRKILNVYVPEGYDAAESTVKYDVFYLMHGGGENENTLLSGPGQPSELKNIFDHMIATHELRPMIVVTPTWYVEDNEDIRYMANIFYEELVRDVMPLVESTYHTYAKDTTPEGMKASREHRAFGGFSMGGACTWMVYLNCMEYFKYYMPLSGDCWALVMRGGIEKTVETVNLLVEAAKEAKQKNLDFVLACATGTEDIAYPNMVPQLEEMKKHTDEFTTGENGNLSFLTKQGATHWWHYVYEYIYRLLPTFFN